MHLLNINVMTFRQMPVFEKESGFLRLKTKKKMTKNLLPYFTHSFLIQYYDHANRESCNEEGIFVLKTEN